MIKFEMNGNAYEMNVIRNHVPMNIEESIIDTIVNGVFVDGEYVPSRFTYHLVSSIILCYTDLNIDDFTNDDICILADMEDVMDAVYSKISSKQFNRIVESVELIVNSKLREHPMKKILDDLHNILSSFSGVLENVDQNVIVEELNKIVNYYITAKNTN